MSKRKMVLSIGNDSKTVKGEKKGFLTGILYLAPHDIAGRGNICPNAVNAGCEKACLYSAGRGGFNSVQTARINKTIRFFEDNENFMLDLAHSIRALKRKAEREGLTPVVRLNGTSDIDWSTQYVNVGPYGVNLFSLFPEVQFYDYTKLPRTANYPNYHLTFSYSAIDSYSKSVEKAHRLGMNMAVVFKGDLPKTFLGLPVINGDDSDLRFLDGDSQVIVGLTAKGKAKKDNSGFVVDSNKIGVVNLAS